MEAKTRKVLSILSLTFLAAALIPLQAAGVPAAAPSEPAGVQVIRPGETLQAHLPPEMAIPALTKPEEIKPGGYDQAKVLALPFPIPNALLFETEAEEAGPLTIEAASLDFDTAIRVSRAGPEGEATILKADDDSGIGSNSRVVVKAEAGARYRIEVFRFQIQGVATAGAEFQVSVRASKPEKQSRSDRRKAFWDYWQQVETVADRNGDPGRTWRAIYEQGELMKAGGPDQVAGAVPRARQLFSRALGIAEESFGPGHHLVAFTLGRYGKYEYHAGDIDKAEEALVRHVELVESLAGPDSVVAAQTKGWLGILLEVRHRITRAKPLLDEAVACLEKNRTEDWMTLMITWAQGGCSCKLGLYDEAEDAFRRYREIFTRIEGTLPEHLRSPGHLGIYKQRARCFMDRQLYGEAGEILQQAERYIEEEIEGRLEMDSNLADEVSHFYSWHGGILYEEGLYDRAKEKLEKALLLQRERVRRFSPRVSGSWISAILARLAEITARLGDPGQARSLAAEALSVAEEVFGLESPQVASRRALLAWTLANVGENGAALEAALQSDAVARDRIRHLAGSLPETHALRVAAEGSRGLDLALWLTGHRSDARPDDVDEAWDAVVRSRAMVLDQIASRHLAVTRSADPEVTRLAREHKSAAARLANLLVRGPAPRQSLEDYWKAVDVAKTEKMDAEKTLATASERFREVREQERAGLEEVLGSLPKGSALVGIRVHKAYTFPPPRTRPVDRFAYAAFVAGSSRSKPVIVPLGPAEKIDEAVECWREAAGTSVGGQTDACNLDQRKAGAALRRMIWDPIAARLGEVKRVFIVPDGDLHFVDFAALPVGANRYLLEEGPAIQYLSAERDLVLPPVTAKPGKGLLAMGNPAFDTRSTFAALGKPGPQSEEPVAVADAGSAFRGPRSECAPFAAHRFDPLPASGDEVSEIVALWPQPDEVKALTGDAATEEAFKREALGHRVVHLATHGFYLGGDACPSALGDHRGFGQVVVEDLKELPPLRGENPLVLSGLVLAGANNREHADEDEEDGILTAQEIAATDLSSVEWAVLSACDTGVGKVLAGEGVSGLRRAFQIAGADTLIMSLWPVEEQFARQWMKALYEGRLKKGLDTAEAVRHASLTVLNDRRDRGLSDHPFYWAGFVAAGDWR